MPKSVLRRKLLDVGRLLQIVGRDVSEQQGVEHALPAKGAHIARKHPVGDFEAGPRGGEPGHLDQPVVAAGEVVRQPEGLLRGYRWNC